MAALFAALIHFFENTNKFLSASTTKTNITISLCKNKNLAKYTRQSAVLVKADIRCMSQSAELIFYIERRRNSSFKHFINISYGSKNIFAHFFDVCKNKTTTENRIEIDSKPKNPILTL